MDKEWSKVVFAKNLKKYVEQSRKSQKEIAEVIGVTAPTFNEWINAKKFPRIDKIQRLADYFGIVKSDLIEEKEPATNGDGLSESQRKLIEFAKTLDEAQAGKVLQLMQSILAFDE